MIKTITLRPHHFNILMLTWYPRRHWGGNPIRGFRKEYGLEFAEFWRNLSEEIRNNGDLLIEPTPSLDTVCEKCYQTAPRRYRHFCEEPDSDYRNGIRLFHDMNLEFSIRYPAKDIVKKMTEWAKKYPYLPLME